MRAHKHEQKTTSVVHKPGSTTDTMMGHDGQTRPKYLGTEDFGACRQKRGGGCHRAKHEPGAGPAEPMYPTAGTSSLPSLQSVCHTNRCMGTSHMFTLSLHQCVLTPREQVSAPVRLHSSTESCRGTLRHEAAALSKHHAASEQQHIRVHHGKTGVHTRHFPWWHTHTPHTARHAMTTHLFTS